MVLNVANILQEHQPDVGNFLSSLRDAQQNQRAQAQEGRQAQAFGQQQNMQAIDQLGAALDGVKDGDAAAFDQVKQFAVQNKLIDPTEAAKYSVNDLPRIRALSQQARQMAAQRTTQEQQGKEFALKERGAVLDERQFGESARHNRAMEAQAGAGGRLGHVDPNTGVRTPPAGVQGKDYTELSKFTQSADAAANIASTLRGIAPALGKGQTGPGAGGVRNAAGVMSFLPDPLGLSDNRANDFVNNFDAIEQASKTIGIDTLQKVGGSDTERELLTAIQTTVNNDVLPEENKRRFENQIAAADILAQKARLASEWVNKFGSLAYAAPDGTTWQGFWPQFQKAAWADHQGKMEGAANPNRGRDYRGEQRRLLNSQPQQQAGPKPPPGFEIIKK